MQDITKKIIQYWDNIYSLSDESKNMLSYQIDHLAKKEKKELLIHAYSRFQEYSLKNHYSKKQIF